MRKRTLRQILVLIRPYMHYLIFSLIFSVISVASSLYAPILVGDAVDYIIAKGQVQFDRILQILFQSILIKFLFLMQQLIQVLLIQVQHL